MGLLEGMFNNINKNWGLYTGALLRGLWREELPVLQGLGLVERTVTMCSTTAWLLKRTVASVKGLGHVGRTVTVCSTTAWLVERTVAGAGRTGACR